MPLVVRRWTILPSLWFGVQMDGNQRLQVGSFSTIIFPSLQHSTCTFPARTGLGGEAGHFARSIIAENVWILFLK